ncbi:type I restriction-modification enzyme R subunit C-terminal domain-containing protein [Phycisphaerales bacterium AB-hyl4]|uniref:Type I restriction-modification enzyme R subunit C-terminal domain-containing protein n=1 Tax=Natronomicrosphaera hydrolytica TaxID=3242702 RepID=A0ABV4UB32_9BACT
MASIWKSWSDRSCGCDELNDQQLEEIEREFARQALKPFHNPRLREAVLTASQQSTEQVIDEISRDQLLDAGYSAAAKEKAQTLVSHFRQFIDEHKDEIEALKLLYSQPHRAGLRYGQVKELARALRQPPLSLNTDHPEQPLWQAYHALEPDKVRGQNKALVDLIALVRHAIEPATPLSILPGRSLIRDYYPPPSRWIDQTSNVTRIVNHDAILARIMHGPIEKTAFVCSNSVTTTEFDPHGGR